MDERAAMSESSESPVPVEVDGTAAAPAAAASIAVGAQLAAARTARNLAVVDIARQLKLSPWQVEALEADNYERLPGSVFVRGFIRNYARLVDLDAAALLAGAELRLPRRERPTAELPPSANIPFKTGRAIPWHRYAIVVLALLVPVIIFEFFYHDENPVMTKLSSPQPVVLPQSMVGIAPTESEGSAAVTANTAANAAATKAADAANASAQAEKASEEIPVPVVRVAAVDGQHRLSFLFNQESWAEVRDGHGQRIFSQLNAAGSQQTVSGTPPLRLVVGNASGVRLQVNNKPFDLVPYTAIDVARFTLE